MTSAAAVWRPAAGETSKKIGVASEVTALSLKSGTGAATVALHDVTDASQANQNTVKWVLDAAIGGNDNQSFASPIIFTRGIVAVVEQGDGNNLALCVAAKKYSAS